MESVVSRIRIRGPLVVCLDRRTFNEAWASARPGSHDENSLLQPLGDDARIQRCDHRHLQAFSLVAEEVRWVLDRVLK